MKKMSIIVPCYNEEKNVKIFYDEVLNCFKDLKLKIELIFVNDGSKDKTIMELRKLVKKNDFSVKVINFSRNFGKEAAMYAGLENSNGDYCVFIDADLQQPPKLILRMLDEIEKDEDIDMVAYYQDKRNESKVLAFFKKSFYNIINKISDVDFVNGASDFRLFKRSVADSLLQLKEMDRFSKGIFSWVGYNTIYLPYVAEERKYGKTSWNFFSLFKYAYSGILSFSNFLLKMPIILASLMLIISIIFFIVFLILGIMKVEISITYLIINTIIFFSGLNLLFIGFIGEYISRIYNETRKRPIYIAKDVINNEKNN